jgi:predicted ferric reductase
VDTHFYWYLTRASGTVAFWLLALSSMFGVAMSSRLWDKIAGRRWPFEVHRFSSLLALAFVGLHMAALIPDQWTNFTPADLLVPGLSTYRPLAVAMGVVAMYGAVVVVASFYVRKLIGYKTWRTLHYGTFAVFVLVLLHGIYAGTDSGEVWMRWSYLTAGMGLFFLTAYRIMAPAEPQSPARRPPSREATSLPFADGG